MLLSTAYFPSQSWFRAFLSEENAVIDIHEHYRKQSWRNRCRIIGPNGIQDLSIPVHLEGNHTPVQNVRIDYSEKWQQRHWGAIEAAYGQSPFFDFYADYFQPFYSQKKWERLIDYNSEILNLILRLTKMKMDWTYSNSFIPYSENDFRLSLSPKSVPPESVMNGNSYIQVFQERHGFVNDLSMLDLLCCTGPQASKFLGTKR